MYLYYSELLMPNNLEHSWISVSDVIYRRYPLSNLILKSGSWF